MNLYLPSKSHSENNTIGKGLFLIENFLDYECSENSNESE